MARANRHDSELGWWEMRRSDPDPRLRPHVVGYCGYAEETAAFSRRRELATANAVLVVGFDGPLEVSFPALGEDLRGGAFVSGVSDSYAVGDSFGSQRGVQVDLTPLGAFMLLGRPMHELANRAIPLEDALGPEGARLPERLHDAGGWGERFAAVDELLLRRFAVARPATPDVAWAWRRLVEAEGRLGVGELAAELRCSRRHLGARFGEQVGLPPRTLARLLRFGRALRLLRSEPRPALARIAAECGYYDQAHLNRDFRDFAGMAPTEVEAMFLPDGGGVADRSDFPSFQDATAVRS